ncbi:hypothetical protein LZD49_27710 [Dyadobacter sp. CY261]|uniref:hypothetical protein n=1 Tax=Dyadobacter sp. CY261 TaxID=2907203 RepID=UPI001F2687ED|nr:hypothetical protein [Dyadobacter sp. CY261]MCF0074302.1 hypothetical protein [Dyadobacter sp. CY261]
MTLPDQLAGLIRTFQIEFKNLKELNSELTDEDIYNILGPGFSHTSVMRMTNAERRGYGTKLRDKTITAKLPVGIRRLKDEISKYAKAKSALTTAALTQEAVLNKYHQFKFWWWDPREKVHVETQRFTGGVAEGVLKLPLHWEGEGASLVLSDERSFTGFVWSQFFGGTSKNITVRFASPGKPDLLMVFNIEDEQKMDLLTGTFASADPVQFNLRHGAFYLTHDTTLAGEPFEPEQTDTDLDTKQIPRKPKKKSNGKVAIEPILVAKIRQNLFHQTFEVKVGSQNALPEHIHSSHDTLINEFVDRYFIGHFINAPQAKLESFILSVDSDGRVTIKYENFKVDYGHFRLFHDDIIRIDVDFDGDWKAFRYRFYFDRQISQKPWYFGFGAGAEKVGLNIFMNRVAMKEVDIAPAKPWESISLNRANRNKIAERLDQDPILRDYLSGKESDHIFNNDTLTETPTILKLAGLLK